MPFTALDRDLAEAAPVTDLGAPRTSGGMTLTQMQDELDALMGRRADVDTDRFALWINWAYQDICTSLKIDELRGSLALPVVAGQPLYLLPYVVDTIESLSVVLPESSRITEGFPLDKIDLPTFRTFVEAKGEPRTFFRYTDMLVVWPTPDAARTLAMDFRIRPQPLEDPGDVPILPQEWHEGIVLGARQRGFSSLMEFDKAAAAGNEYISFLRRRTDREAEEQSNRVIGSSAPHRMRDIRNRTLWDRTFGRET